MPESLDEDDRKTSFLGSRGTERSDSTVIHVNTGGDDDKIRAGGAPAPLQRQNSVAQNFARAAMPDFANGLFARAASQKDLEEEPEIVRGWENEEVRRFQSEFKDGLGEAIGDFLPKDLIGIISEYTAPEEREPPAEMLARQRARAEQKAENRSLFAIFCCVFVFVGGIMALEGYFLSLGLKFRDSDVDHCATLGQWYMVTSIAFFSKFTYDMLWAFAIACGIAGEHWNDVKITKTAYDWFVFGWNCYAISLLRKGTEPAETCMEAYEAVYWYLVSSVSLLGLLICCGCCIGAWQEATH